MTLFSSRFSAMIGLTNVNVNPVYWDADNDGIKEACAWVKADDALLVLDKNGNGLIDNHSELFGTQTVDGFTILRGLDSNKNSKIDSSDAKFAELRIWQDLNQDGISQTNELKTLTQIGLKSIDLNAILTINPVAQHQNICYR